MRRLAFLLAPLALVLAACGGVEGRGSLSADPVAAAASKTRAQGSERFTVSMTGTAGSGQRLVIAGRGVSNSDGSGRVTLAFADDGTRRHMEAITKDFVVYMRSDVFQSELPSGKSWVKLDLEKLGKKAGFDLSSLQGAQQGNAASALDALRGAGKTEKVGRETVAGVSTTHYHAIVDLEKAAASSDKARESMKKVIEQIGTKTIPVDVWVDRKGLVRKTTYEQPFAKGLPPMRFTYVFTSFGGAVSIETPPSSDVVDIFDLLFGG